MENIETTAKPKTDDEILAAFEAEGKKRDEERAAETKAATVTAIKKLNELREKEPGAELFIAGDENGPFRGVFRVPSMTIWKTFQAELRMEAQRAAAGHNLVMQCLVWPTRDDLVAAAAKRPALIGVLSGLVAVEAGSGQDGYRKK